MAGCYQHPTKPASYVCEDCGCQQCDDCVTMGTALFMCGHCGERAHPLRVSQPTRPKDIKKVARRQKVPTFTEALLYPFRGAGLMIFITGVLLIFLTVFTVTYALGCILKLLSLFWVGLCLLLFPAISFLIVRKTSEGEDELPDWPEVSHYVERIRDLFGFVLASMVMGIPIVVMLYFGGFFSTDFFPSSPSMSEESIEDTMDEWDDDEDFTDMVERMAREEQENKANHGNYLEEIERVQKERAKAMVWPVTLGSIIGIFLFLPAFGATAAYQSPWLTLRFDLHWKYHQIVGADGVRTAFSVALLQLGSGLVEAATIGIPMAGKMISLTVSIYVLFTASHLIGLLFRKYYTPLEQLYLGS